MSPTNCWISQGQLCRIIYIIYMQLYFTYIIAIKLTPTKISQLQFCVCFFVFCFWQRTGRHGTIKSVSNEYGSSEPPIPRTSSSSGRRILGSKTKSLRCAIATAASWGMEARQMEWSSKYCNSNNEVFLGQNQSSHIVVLFFSFLNANGINIMKYKESYIATSSPPECTESSFPRFHQGIQVHQRHCIHVSINPTIDVQNRIGR